MRIKLLCFSLIFVTFSIKLCVLDTTKSGFEYSLDKHNWSHFSRVEVEVISCNLEVIRKSLKKLKKEIIAFAQKQFLLQQLMILMSFSNPGKHTVHFEIVL